MTPSARIQKLRADADLLRAYGQRSAARLLLNVAADLETDLAELESTPIGRAAFAQAAGVHPDSVTRAVRSGRVTLTVGDVSKVQPHRKRAAAPSQEPGSPSTLDRFSRRAVATSSRGRT